MLNHAKGNLITLAEQGQFDVIVHGCNTMNVMGAGIAKEIKRRYPRAYEADSNMHNKFGLHPIELLGNFSESVSSTVDSNPFMIINAYTQMTVGGGKDNFEYESFSLILRKLSAIYPDKRFGFPYIGMGLGGGDPDQIIPLLYYFACDVNKTGGSATLVEYR